MEVSFSSALFSRGEGKVLKEILDFELTCSISLNFMNIEHEM